ncbi:hypothetical protein [Sorangium sp. So ce131]|uniref:hypothetical protein n=1 Tax=Sorangium sp. So ce131 TaxID=3133282 RepID=UPI003F5EBEBE
MTLFATINGHRVLTARVHVPFAGLWYADVELDDAEQLSGAAVVKLGSLELRGTVLAPFSGTFQLSTRVRVVAGAGGWSRRCKARHFHNDAGVTLRSVLTATAADVGETFDLAGIDGRLAVDFVREAGPASRVLRHLLGATPWWVGYDGTTRAGLRPQVEASGKDYELLNFDPRAKVAELAVDDPAAVEIGSVLRARLDCPVVVQQLDVEMSKGALRVSAWGQELAA